MILETSELTWIVLFPDWYRQEREGLARCYPSLVVDQLLLRQQGVLLYRGKLAVHPPGGTVEHAVRLHYPEATPYAAPVVTPLQEMPTLDELGHAETEPAPRMFDHRHQMPSGNLCLFQHNPRSALGPETIRGIDALRRAEQWLLGHHTGHWPPDTAESELEAHFRLIYDMLVGEPFYATDISGHGRFYAAPVLGRIAKDPGNVPFILTSITSEASGIVVPRDARGSLGNTFPQIHSAAWGLGQLPEAEQTEDVEQLLKKHLLFRGYWWDLASEPMPFHNGRGLLKAMQLAVSGQDSWELLKQALGSRLQTEEEHLIGLRYPARRGGLEWLVLSIEMPPQSGSGGAVPILSDQDKRALFEDARVNGVRVHSCRPEDLRRRNTGVITHAVTNKEVALIGLGALGSVVADLLAKAGVGSFRLCDHDRLTPGNVARHVGGLSESGAYKTRVVKTRLFEINPYLRIREEDVHTTSAVGSLDRLRAFLEPVDLVVSTMADEGAEAVLNQVAVDAGIPVVYARALRRGKIGRVFIVRPRQDACKACVATYARSEAAGERAPPDWISVRELEEDVLVHECGRPVIPASAMDMSFIAGLTARIALDHLEGNSLEGNHWIWSANPAPDVDDRLSTAMQVLPLTLEPNAECPICREPPIDCLLLTESTRADIIAMAEASPDAESCGILIGYVDDRYQAIALRAIGPGPEAERSRSICSRDPQFTQEHLEAAIEELGERGHYLGEWHSHLEANPTPGPTDIDSLFGIARAPNYLNRCPVMVIVAIDKDSTKRFHVSVYPHNGRGHSIPYEVIRDEEALTYKIRSRTGML